MRKFFKTLWSIVWPVVIYVILAVIVETAFSISMVFRQYFETGSFDLNAIMDAVVQKSLYTTGIVNLISIIIFALIIRSDRKKYPGPSDVQYPNITLAAVMAAVGGCLVGNIILSASGILESDEAFNVINDAILQSSVWVQIAVAVVLGPITEELLFRGIVYKRVDRAYGFWPAAIVSSLAFGALHGNLSQFIYAALLGMLLAYAYHKSGRLWVCILMHMIANAASLAIDSLIMLVPDPDAATIVLLVIGAVLLGAGLFIMIKKPVKSK